MTLRLAQSQAVNSMPTKETCVINIIKSKKKIMQIIYTTCGVTLNSKGKAMSSGKFRISLSLAQINWILEHCQDDMPELHKQLMLLKTKADLGYVKPAYELAPARQPAPKKIKQSDFISKEEAYKQAMSYVTNDLPIPEHLKEGYDLYRYDNGLMTPEEVTAYESLMFPDF